MDAMLIVVAAFALVAFVLVTLCGTLDQLGTLIL